jgi:uncharacterized protein (TIGR02145 family)
LDSYVGSQGFGCGGNSHNINKALATIPQWQWTNINCTPGTGDNSNAVGFSASPVGRFNSVADYDNQHAIFWTTNQSQWSATVTDWAWACCYDISYTQPAPLYSDKTAKYSGFSVRCVRNAEN